MNAPARTRDQETWLSMQEASAMLGVSPATLRRWSAAGEVDAFTTPGGHRRFALTTLQALLARPAAAPVRLASLGESGERMVRVLRRHPRPVPESAWLGSLPDAERGVLKALGREATEALVAYLNATRRDPRRVALARAEEAGAVQGRLAAGLGAPLGDLVDLFLHFRGHFVAELADVAVRHGLDSATATALVTRGGEAADRVLAAAVAAYDEAGRPPAAPQSR